METLERLGAGDLKAVVSAYRDALRAHQETINRLNVYPVPDGDTGTNMALTLESVVAEIEAKATETMPEVTKALSHGSLMGARGNSGVILSQILRGLAETFKEDATIDGPVLAQALAIARDDAYRAVLRPVEGTILTVISAGAGGAEGPGQAGEPLRVVAESARQAAAEALAHTPELLPALAQAGVVDAGGAGLVLLFDALLHVVDGRPLPSAENTGWDGATRTREASLPGEHVGAPEVGSLRYEVMYLLDAPDEAIPGFRQVWAGLGDSIVVVGGDGLWNCHIHTADIGAAIEASLDIGRPRSIRVSDLAEQVEEERWVREGAQGVGATTAIAPEPQRCAVVAVATGDGIGRIFHSLGVREIVAGGQSMNPSTAEVLAAVDRIDAAEVIVLPNNTNVVPVAEQAAALSAKAVRVVPTRDVAEGFAALLEYDPESDVEANLAAMTASSLRVVSGEVTQAVRSSNSQAGPIKAGDFLGLSRSGIEVVATTAAEAACDLLAKLVTEGHEIVTVIEGEGATPADTRRIAEWVALHRPVATHEVLQGGQPLYPYLFSIE